MNFVSTRGGVAPTPIDVALAGGLAPDGGLYVPARIPELAFVRPFAELKGTACALLAPYFHESSLSGQLGEICAQAFSFDAPLVAMQGKDDWLLELFHGPTAAFKDYAARFLAESLSQLRPADAPRTTILVATSGDTGAAVAAAFHCRSGFEVVILYPDGGVSPRQAHGLGCWGDNVRAFRVDGTFDDCQNLAKQALADDSLRHDVRLTTANSISLGRLLPQMAYYAHAALGFRAAHGTALNFIIPTGNLGNACAAVLSRRMGMPLGEICIATNSNDVLPRFFVGEAYAPQAARTTLANAMDVGNPSNFERLRYWHASDAELRDAYHARAVDDARISDVIRRSPGAHGMVPCPHTATALHLLEELRAQGDRRAWCVVATAHPAKFDSIVEPLIGRSIELPQALADCLERPAYSTPLANDYPSLRDLLRL